MTPIGLAMTLGRGDELLDLLLLREDLDLGRVNKDGLTPMAMAERSGNTVILRQLQSVLESTNLYQTPMEESVVDVEELQNVTTLGTSTPIRSSPV